MKIIKTCLLTYLLCILISPLNGQTPNALVIYESDNQGLIVPQMTSEERESITPNANEKGLLVYDLDLAELMDWNGSKWQKASSPWNQKNDFKVINFSASRNSYGVEIFNTPADSIFASGLYTRGKFYGVRGETTSSSGLTAGVSGKGGAFGVHAVNTNGTAALYAVSNGTAKAAIFEGEVQTQGLITSDTLLSTEVFLNIKPTTVDYTCDSSTEGMIQYFKTDRKIRACIEINSTPTYQWVNLH